MIDNLKALIIEIKQKYEEDFNALKGIRNFNYFYYSYEEMLSNWLMQIRKGNHGLLDKIESLLKIELSKMEANGERPSSKLKNPMMLLTIFKQKLNRLHFEIDVSKIKNNEHTCYCFLRQKYHLNPSNTEMLVKCGSVYFLHRNDEYVLYECEKCLAKWIHAYTSELYLSKVWMKWHSKDYPLKE